MENISDQIDKKSDKRFAVRVFVVGVIFSIMSIFISVDIFKESKATVSILVIPKSQTVAVQSEAVVKNIVEFPKTLAFYEKLLKFNPEIKDGFSEMNPVERKKAWNGRLEVSGNKSSIIKLTVFAQTPEQAEALSRKTTNTLFGVVSNFYDIKTDIGISVIDGPIVSSVWRNWFVAVPFSIIFGFAVSFLLNVLLGWLEKKSISVRSSLRKSPLAGLKDKIGMSAEEKKLVPKEEDFFQDVPYYFEEISDKKSAPKSSSAPSNLPIADEMPFVFKEPKEEEKEVAKEENFIQLKKEEPSEEEMKNRLNKLLMGDM